MAMKNTILNTLTTGALAIALGATLAKTTTRAMAAEVVDSDGNVSSLNINEQNMPVLSSGQTGEATPNIAIPTAMFGGDNARPVAVEQGVELGVDGNAAAALDGYIDRANLANVSNGADGLGTGRQINNASILEDYNMQVMLDKKNAEAYYQRANFKKKINDYQGALEDYQYILAMRSDMAGNYGKLASNQVMLIQKSLSSNAK